MDITADNANQIIAEVASGTSLTDFKSRIDVTRDGVTVSDEEMTRDIAEQENYKPVSEEDIAAIRAEILKARTTEIPDGTKFVDDEKENDEWVEKQKEWNEKVRKEVEAMTDEEVVAWAKNLNQQFNSVVEAQKKDFEMYKGGVKFTGEANHDNDPVYKWKTPDQQRRHFLRLTNPKRKRGDPISKEPEQFQRMLRQCVAIREIMDFDKMSKLELKTRLIQNLAISTINTSCMQERNFYLLSKLHLVRKGIKRFFDRHPELREDYESVCEQTKKEFGEPKVADR